MCDKKVCPNCKKEKHKGEFYNRRGVEGSSSYCKKCTVAQTAVRLKAVKALAVEYKGGKCAICGYDKCNDALDFHHIDPTQKEYNISSVKSKNIEALKKELDKCVLLCSNCHREVHAGVSVCPGAELIVSDTEEWIPREYKELEVVPLDSYMRPVHKTKIEWPSAEDMEKLVWEYPLTHIAKSLGVSDVAVGKFLQKNGIKKPPNGYWLRTPK
jgi:hypothetical protein